MPGMRRREFVALLGGGAAAWPLTSLAQAPERMRRIGMLMPLAADDREAPARVAAFQQGLQQLGWTIGRNVQIENRWGAGDPDRIRKHVTELIALAPDVILAHGERSSSATAPGDPHHTNRVPGGRRSGRRRFRR